MNWRRLRTDRMQAGPVIRWARRRDAAPLAAMSKAFRAEIGESTVGLTEAAYLRDGFGRKKEFDVLIAEAPTGPAGYALFLETYEPNYSERGLYLADLYVTPEYRRAGIGRMLVACVAAESRRRQRSFVWWVALATNPEAHAFYERLGVIAVPVMAHAAAGERFKQLANEAPPVRR